MSGGGSSYSSAPTQTCPCDSLVFTAILQSPNSTAVKKLKVGDELELEKRGDNGPVVAKHPRYGDIGSIVSRIADLLRCMDDNFSFKATVKDISGLQVRVEVRPE